MKKLLFSLLLIILSFPIFASRLLVAGDNLIYALTIDSSLRGTGDFVELKGDGLCDGVLVKYDKDLTFKKMVSSACANQVGFYDAAYDKKGYVVVLAFAEEGAFGSGILKDLKPIGGTDIVVIKYDMDLNIVNIKNIGSKKDDWGNRIIISDKGQYIVAGRQTQKSRTEGVLYSLSDNLELIKSATFAGSFEKPFDSEYTNFNNVIETKNGGYAVCGLTAYVNGENINSNRGLIVVFDENLIVKKKASFGSNTEWITLCDLIEKPEGGFITIGSTGGDVERGVLLDLNKNLIKTDVKFHSPTLRGEKPNYNILKSIQPFMGNGGGYLIFGSTYYNNRGYVVYYMVYDSKDGFDEICSLPDKSDIDYYVGPDSSFYIIGYDKEGMLSPDTNAWF